MGIPRKVGPNYIRSIIAQWSSDGAASALAPDFAANTLLTIFGGAGGFKPGFWAEIEKLRFTVGNADATGAAATLTFELRKNSATGTAIASLTITLATALRGAVLEGVVTATLDETAKISPNDTLFLVRLATGTVFTALQGDWSIVARQVPQSKGQ